MDLLLESPSGTAALLVGVAIVAVFVTQAAKWPAWVAGIIITVSAVLPFIGWSDAGTAVIKGQWMRVVLGVVAAGVLAIVIGVWLERRRGKR